MFFNEKQKISNSNDNHTTRSSCYNKYRIFYK